MGYTHDMHYIHGWIIYITYITYIAYIAYNIHGMNYIHYIYTIHPIHRNRPTDGRRDKQILISSNGAKQDGRSGI